MAVIDWLLDSDPAIRWQVLRDLLDASPATVTAERNRIATEGWGARLLSLVGPDGQWDNGAFWPNGRSYQPNPAHPGQPWTATCNTLVMLRDFGIDPAMPAMRRIIHLIAQNSRWEHGNQPFFQGEVEPCINGMAVAVGAYFGQDVRGIVMRLLSEQLADGGWNCEAENGSVRSSFHTTLRVLEGLLAWEQVTGDTLTRSALQQAEEYLLTRHLFRRKFTGEVIDPAFLQLSWPTRWRYDVLRGLEYFRATGATPDPRLQEAITLLESKRQPDGTWLLENTHPGKVWFPLEPGDGQTSRWNTLRALRVLRWYHATGPLTT